MPSVPCVSPSEMTGVPHTNALPPARSTASTTRSAISFRWLLHGSAFDHGMPTVMMGLSKSSSFQPHASRFEREFVILSHEPSSPGSLSFEPVRWCDRHFRVLNCRPRTCATRRGSRRTG